MHPGEAKDTMVNALRLPLISTINYLKTNVQKNEGREGFFHLHKLEGTVDQASMGYIIRDHDSRSLRLKGVVKDVADK